MAAPASERVRILVRRDKTQLEVEAPLDGSMRQLKALLAGKELEPDYVKLIYKGHVVDNDQTVQELGIRSGGKLMMLFTETYYEDAPMLEKLEALKADLEPLEAKAQALAAAFREQGRTAESDRECVVLEELLTGLMERIDGVETHGRPILRSSRKRLVCRAQEASDTARSAR
uniref:Ubiquitin-like domain-containing protein n=1 Tax=Rhizochromulina marina TaxID=1034831 RepID=A0A7S2RJU7_9STRA|mmetsp:Transcript_17284/g.50403  ORF Transcript_17284/g.50403 Transcript_17284/m.50403 type:complete len:173 (+) Transcript_17284:21-539(+)